MSHHDLMFKGIFGQPEHAGPYLQAQLPPAVVKRIDWGTLALEPGSYVDEALGARHSDLLYSARVASRLAGVESTATATAWTLLYVLLEHQSTIDPLMPFRILAYMVRIWERWLATHPLERRLPPIIPLVLYQGPRRWTGPLSFAELVLGHLDPTLADPLRPHVPDFALRLHDLSTVPDADLRDPVVWQRTLSILKNIHRPELGDWLGDWMSALPEIARQPGGLRALRMLLSYLIEARDDATPATIIQTAGAARREVEELVMSVAEKLREEGRQEGRQEGLEEGRRQERRALLMRQLTLRFGDAARQESGRLERATPEQLERWAERILVAETLDGVFE